MRAAVAGPLHPPDAAATPDPAGRLLRAAVPPGEGGDDGPGTALPGLRPRSDAAAASFLADHGVGASQSLVRRRLAAGPAAGRAGGTCLTFTLYAAQAA